MNDRAVGPGRTRIGDSALFVRTPAHRGSRQESHGQSLGAARAPKCNATLRGSLHWPWSNFTEPIESCTAAASNWARLLFILVGSLTSFVCRLRNSASHSLLSRVCRLYSSSSFISVPVATSSSSSFGS